MHTCYECRHIYVNVKASEKVLLKVIKFIKRMKGIYRERCKIVAVHNTS